MAVVVTCSHCRVSFRVKDELRGTRGKCPQCQHVITIPAAPRETPASVTVQPRAAAATAGKPAQVPSEPRPGASAPKLRLPAKPLEAGSPASRPSRSAKATRTAQPSLQERHRTILAAFQGQVEPAPLPLRYRLAVALVSACMVAIPVIYALLIGLVGYAVYYHAVNHTEILTSASSSRGRAGTVIIYLGPIVVGAFVVLFMIKPFFARSARDLGRRSLTREQEPLLFAFVERVCDAVGAPRPRRIDVDCQVNASASFRRGWLSLLSGPDLVLTIGLPLVAGLNLRQFGGVLAHEFGHFAQGAGMRLSYIVRSISYWLTRAVYERDHWDEWLAHGAASLDIRIGWVLYLTQFCVWLTRRVLWVLMITGHAVSGFLLRQMEFDADRYEARLAGSDVFESTCRQLQVLNAANEGALADLGSFYRDGRLADNLPRLIVHNIKQLDRRILLQLEKAIQETPTGLFDTHPADRERIASARQENAPGLLRIDGSARALFQDFDRIARDVTGDFYREVFGEQFQPSCVHPLDELLRRQNQEQEAQKALGRFFQGQFGGWRPILLPEDLEESPPAAEVARQLGRFRQQLLASKDAYEKTYEAYKKAAVQQLQLEGVVKLLEARIRPQGEFELPVDSMAVAQETGHKAIALQEQLAARLVPFEQAVGRRLYRALELLHDEAFAAEFAATDEYRKQYAAAWPLLTILRERWNDWLTVRAIETTLDILCSHFEGNSNNERLRQEIVQKMQAATSSVSHLREAFGRVAYPFDHAQGPLSVAEYLLKELPDPQDLQSVYGAISELNGNLISLYVRAVGQLCHVAEQVELALGLDLLPDPPEPAEEASEAAVLAGQPG